MLKNVLYYCVVVALVLAFSGCDKGLDKTQAKQVIEDYLHNNKQPTDTVEIGKFAFQANTYSYGKLITLDTYENGYYKKLHDSGYFAVTFDKQMPSLGMLMNVYQIQETDRLKPFILSREDRRSYILMEKTNNVVISILIGNIEKVEITGTMQQGDKSYLVEFTYNEVLNDIGRALNAANTLRKFPSITTKAGAAEFLRYDDGWRMKQIQTKTVSEVADQATVTHENTHQEIVTYESSSPQQQSTDYETASQTTAAQAVKPVIDSNQPPQENNTSPSAKPSFDCKKATRASELAICSDPDLSKMDNELFSLYKIILGEFKDKKELFNQIRNDQRAWIKSRDLCGSNTSCLSGKYKDRDAQLHVFESENEGE